MDEAALHELLSGRRRDLFAAMVRAVLHVASWGYSSVIRLRNFAYCHRWLRIHRSRVPVISIGNITTGGTGKTPLAAWLANWLIEEGHHPGLLSRGYHALNNGTRSCEDERSGRSTIGNDEKLVLDRLCPSVPHLQQRDRVTSANRAVTEFGCNILLLDDGFQHRRLHRDLDLVLVDALRPWGYGHVLPRGLLREPVSELRRAHVVIITRADQCSLKEHQELIAQLRAIRGTGECVEVAFTPVRLVDQKWQPLSLSMIIGKRAFAFCGIGNPHGFRQTVASLGVACESIEAYPDHHHYKDDDLSKLARLATELSAEIVLTTQKDLVKIASGAWHGPPLYAIEIGVKFLNGQALLESRIRRLFEGDQPVEHQI